MPEYRLREGDQVAVYYRRTREEQSRPYELQVGDRILVESLTAGGGPLANQAGGDVIPKSDVGISRELVDSTGRHDRAAAGGSDPRDASDGRNRSATSSKRPTRSFIACRRSP